MRWKVVAAAACAVAACTGSGIMAGSASAGMTPAGKSVVYPAADWPQFNQSAARTGIGVGVSAAGALTTAWSAHLDGAVYGQPLVVGNDVIAATENNTVYALARTTGAVVWRRHLASPVATSPLRGCGSIWPLGITGTPIYNQANGLVYAVAETSSYRHVLFGLNVLTGAVTVQRDLDIPTTANQNEWNLQSTALAIDAGRVYAGFGGLAPKCGTYVGGVVGVALNGQGPLVSWHTPTTRGGAVWGTAGPVAGPGGTLWVSTGNGAAVAPHAYDGSDSVDSLSPALKRLQFFAPARWSWDNQNGHYLGSTQPVRASNDSTFILGKRGIGYLLSTTRFGGIGGQRASLTICPAFGAAADRGDIAYEPCALGGIAAVYVNSGTRTIRVLWRGPALGNGSPVVGGGAIWVTAYLLGGHTGTLYELNESTGAVQQSIVIGSGLPLDSSLSLGGSSAYLGTLHGVTAVNGA